MCLVALLNLGGSQIILILTLILIFLGARKLPEIAEGWRQGMKEFRKATREVNDEIAEQLHRERSNVRPGHPVLMALTVILGAACLILVVYEFSK